MYRIFEGRFCRGGCLNLSDSDYMHAASFSGNQIENPQRIDLDKAKCLFRQFIINKRVSDS